MNEIVGVLETMNEIEIYEMGDDQFFEILVAILRLDDKGRERLVENDRTILKELIRYAANVTAITTDGQFEPFLHELIARESPIDKEHINTLYADLASRMQSDLKDETTRQQKTMSVQAWKNLLELVLQLHSILINGKGEGEGLEYAKLNDNQIENFVHIYTKLDTYEKQQLEAHEYDYMKKLLLHEMIENPGSIGSYESMQKVFKNFLNKDERINRIYDMFKQVYEIETEADEIKYLITSIISEQEKLYSSDYTSMTDGQIVDLVYKLYNFTTLPRDYLNTIVNQDVLKAAIKNVIRNPSRFSKYDEISNMVDTVIETFSPISNRIKILKNLMTETKDINITEQKINTYAPLVDSYSKVDVKEGLTETKLTDLQILYIVCAFLQLSADKQKKLSQNGFNKLKELLRNVERHKIETYDRILDKLARFADSRD